VNLDQIFFIFFINFFNNFFMIIYLGRYQLMGMM